MYSAVKYDGIPLYRLARQGKTVARQPRQVEILAADLVKWSPPEAEIQVRCGKGTYVRSLAHELGQRLGCGAHLTRLTRTASGSFQIAQAFEEGRGAELILPMDLALQAFPAETVDSSTANKIVSGEQIRLSSVAGTPSRSSEEGTLRRAYTEDGQLIALLRSQGDHLWRPHKVFAQ